MKWKRAEALLIGAGFAAALFAWNHIRSRSVSAIPPEQAAPPSVYLYAAGILAPAAAAKSPAADAGYAARERAFVRTAVKTAEETVRQVDGQLQAARSRLADLEREKSRATIIAADAEREFERSDSLPGSGPAWQIERGSAAAAHASAEKALESVAQRLADAAAQVDALEVKAQDAHKDLREATSGSAAIEAGFDHLRRRPERGRTWFEPDCAVTTPQPLVALVAVRRADVAGISASQEWLVVLDGDPSVAFPGRVSGISDTPVQTPAGIFFPVTLAVDSAQSMEFCGLAVHARWQRTQ